MISIFLKVLKENCVTSTSTSVPATLVSLVGTVWTVLTPTPAAVGQTLLEANARPWSGSVTSIPAGSTLSAWKLLLVC